MKGSIVDCSGFQATLPRSVGITMVFEPNITREEINLHLCISMKTCVYRSWLLCFLTAKTEKKYGYCKKWEKCIKVIPFLNKTAGFYIRSLQNISNLNLKYNIIAYCLHQSPEKKGEFKFRSVSLKLRNKRWNENSISINTFN